MGVDVLPPACASYADVVVGLPFASSTSVERDDCLQTNLETCFAGHFAYGDEIQIQ